MKPLAAHLVLLLAPASFAGDVIVVDASGGGDYTDLQAASFAAADGDTLLVKQGQYGPLNVISKGLTVIADIGHTVTILGGTVIRSTASDQPTHLVRLRCLGSHEPSDLTEHGAIFNGCAGAVRVEGCLIMGATGEGWTGTDNEHGGTGAWITNCADVTLTNCKVLGGDAGHTFACSSGWENRAGHGMVVDQESLASLFQCTVIAGDGFLYDASEIECGGQQGHGAWVIDSRLYGAGTWMEGGQGGRAGLCRTSFPGGDGLRVHGSTAHADVLDMTLVGGPGDSFCGASRGKGLALVGGGSATMLPGVARRLAGASPVRAGAQLPLTFAGPPNERVLLTVSLYPSWQDQIPLLSAPWLGAGPSWVKFLGKMPATGTMTRQWPVNKIPGGLDSEVRYLQAFFLDNSQGWLGSPNTVVVLDPSF